MTVRLADLIRGVGISDEVPATDATQEKGGKLTVAEVASVAVANLSESELCCFSASDKAAVSGWLDSIGEDSPEVVADVLHRCESDQEARDYFVIRSSESLADTGDDRRFCTDCGNLNEYGYCLSALRGELDGLARRYRPWNGLPRRCDRFQSFF